MASLIENLISTLQSENDEYKLLLELSMEKTGIIVRGDVNALNEIVGKEQEIVERINALEKKRIEVTGDIGIVLNKDPKTLKLEYLANALKSQPAESEALKKIHDELKETMGNMVRVNDSNKTLLQESIEMVQFEMNLVQSMKQAPVTANYSKGAYAEGNGYGSQGSFDAKQ